METPLPTQTDTPAETKAKGVWQKTRYPNLIRYIPSGTYFGRLKADGKLIRRSLDTHVLEVAKLRLSDFLKEHRPFTNAKGATVKGEVIIEMYRKEFQNDHQNKDTTKLYKQETDSQQDQFFKEPHTGGNSFPSALLDSDREKKFQKIRKKTSVSN